MKMFTLTLVLITFFGFAKADQLAYLSKTDAERGAEVIKKNKRLVLYCACCSGFSITEVKVLNVKVEYTGYEDYYEVIIEYKDENGKIQSEALDLAYVWTKENKKDDKYITIGQILQLEHDPCSDGEFELE